jgi:superfamily II DNA or RNA helicase
MSKLRSLEFEDLDILADKRIVARGRECVRWGLINDLSESQGQIEAQIADGHGVSCQVQIKDGARGLVTWCTCAAHVDHGEICKHIIAALVAWISRRDGGSSTTETQADGEPVVRPPGTPIQDLRSVIRLVKDRARRKNSRPDPEPEPSPELAGLISGILPADIPVRVQAERGGHTHGLKISFVRDRSKLPARRKRSVGEESDPAFSLTIPPGDVAAAVREMDSLDKVDWTDEASSLKVYFSPVRMRLRAEYAASGVLVLTPLAQVKDSKGESRLIEPIHLHEGLDGTMWVEDGPDTLRRVGMWTSLMERYSPDFKPRILEGADIVEFLSHGHDTGWRGGLDPSERVRSSQVLNEVKLAKVEVSEGPGGWLWLDPVYRAGKHDLALNEILEAQKSGGLVRAGDDWIVMRSGATWSRTGKLQVEGEPEQDLVGAAIPEGAKLTDGRIKASRLAYLRQRAEWGKEVEIAADPALARFEAFLRREGAPPPAPRITGMKGKLRPYQHAGYRWLWFLRESGLGGILADEMGLGKTHQVMAMLLSVYNEGAAADGGSNPGPSLVVCPRSVLDHWEDKVNDFAPALSPLVYHGGERERARGNLVRQRLVITTYGVLARDIEHLSEIPWETVILDEAQYIKNSATKAARAARKLRSPHRFALTGTPLENHLGELRSIIDFVLPGYLGSTEKFRRRFARPIETGDNKTLEVLKRALFPFKLRRMKAQVLTDLPPKIEDFRYSELTPHQAVLYREILGRAKTSGLMDKLQNPTEKIDYMHVFSVLSRLKQLCDHPSLILEGKSARNLTSGKFEVFKEVIGEALEAGEKVVVFSQYLGMLDLIEEHLKSLGVKFSGLRGATRNRGKVIKKFQEEEECRVFVASLLAGGLGVDLTAASVVIHYDRWWNAAREDQATDRVHRIGQSRGVQVFRLITKGTLEDRIDVIIQRKKALANKLLESDPAVSLKLLSRDDLLSILSPPDDKPKELSR